MSPAKPKLVNVLADFCRYVNAGTLILTALFFLLLPEPSSFTNCRIRNLGS